MKDLSAKAMLVDLDVRCWSAKIVESKVADHVAKTYKASRQAVITHKKLLPPSSFHAAIRSAVTSARALHDHHSLPWTRRGFNILPVANFEQYSEEMRKAVRTFNEAADEFAKRYEGIRQNARKYLGDLFDESNYPSTREVRGLFSMRVHVAPVQQASDFRVNVSQSDLKELRKEIEADVATSITGAVQDLWQRLYDVVAKVTQRLKEPDAVFHASLIGNLEAVCDLLPRLNLTGDKKLDEVRKEIQASLTKILPDTLREDKEERKRVAKKAASIQSKIESIMKRMEQ